MDVCIKCGASGYEDLLAFCNKCNKFAQHVYCLDGIRPFDVRKDYLSTWKCEICKYEISFENMSSPKKIKDSEKFAKSEKIESGKLGKSLSLDGEHVGEARGNAIISTRRKCNLFEKLKKHMKLVERKNRKLISPNNDLSKDFDANMWILTKKRKKKRVISKRRRKLLIYDKEGFEVKMTNQIELPLFDRLFEGERIDGHPNFHLEKSPIIDKEPSNLLVEPFSQHFWRGFLYTREEEYGPFVAHFSVRICEKAKEAAKCLSAVLSAELVPRLEAWPNQFKVYPPIDDNIGLYIFPDVGDSRAQSVYGSLLDNLISNDMILRVVLASVELLIFTSNLLPFGSREYRQQVYLWGVFRPRRLPTLLLPSQSLLEVKNMAENSEAEDNKKSKDTIINLCVTKRQQSEVFETRAVSVGETELCGGQEREEGEISDGDKRRVDEQQHWCGGISSVSAGGFLGLFPLRSQDLVLIKSGSGATFPNKKLNLRRADGVELVGSILGGKDCNMGSNKLPCLVLP